MKGMSEEEFVKKAQRAIYLYEEYGGDLNQIGIECGLHFSWTGRARNLGLLPKVEDVEKIWNNELQIKWIKFVDWANKCEHWKRIRDGFKEIVGLGRVWFNSVRDFAKKNGLPVPVNRRERHVKRKVKKWFY